MTNPSPRTVLLQLCENDTLGRVTVDEEHYNQFEDAGDERMEKLVDAWKHLAAPIAQRVRRTKTK